MPEARIEWVSKPAEPHRHRCKECREWMPVLCADTICDEGMRWVVLCIDCWERLHAS